ncbi:MAG: aminoacyl--tRNA ligase-related protein, partial [Candidatus Moraniibacteriota bacterium]
AKNAQLLIQAGFVDKLMAGTYSFLPLGLRVFKKIENIIREEMENLGANEILMPTLQPKENWQTTGRWEQLDNLFRFVSYYSKIDYALGATHEEIVVPLMKKFVFSYKDLPTATFQIQNKFRDEKRAKSGILRGREFFMKDLYSFHATEEDLDAYYEKAIKAYEKIFQRVGVGAQTYLTYASGGTFSKYSHEFQTICEAGEDLIYICDKCKVAINEEIIEDLNHQCPQCQNADLRKEKAVETGNIFKLMTKYSKPFELKFKDQDGNENEVIMGCYGIGLNRLMGVAVELFNDDKGIIWPESIAPFAVHLIDLGQAEQAEKIYAELSCAGVEILWDDREVRAGEKFADSDLIGIPYRVVVSEKSLQAGGVELKKRNEQESKIVTMEELISLLRK